LQRAINELDIQKGKYTIMMKEAFKLWEQLERESSTKLFR